jgi:hypothetical protein
MPWPVGLTDFQTGSSYTLKHSLFSSERIEVFVLHVGDDRNRPWARVQRPPPPHVPHACTHVPKGGRFMDLKFFYSENMNFQNNTARNIKWALLLFVLQLMTSFCLYSYYSGLYTELHCVPLYNTASHNEKLEMN